MKAIQMTEFGDSDVLTLVNTPELTLTEDDVLISLYSAGVNPAESYIRQGGYVFYHPVFPYTPGFDGAGIIEKIGSSVTHLKVGDRVFISSCLDQSATGTYAEQMVCSSKSVRQLPDTLSFNQGAALGIPASAAYRGLFQRGKLQKNEIILIHGATGGVGSLAVQMAKSCGAFVIGTAGSLAGIEKVKKLGADMALNHHDTHYLDNIPPVDLVLEMLANVNLTKDLNIIKRYGRIVIIGSRGPLDINPRLAMEKEADILGMAVWNSSFKENKDSLDAIEKMIYNNQLIPDIAFSYPLEKASQAQDDTINTSVTGKIILEIQPEP